MNKEILFKQVKCKGFYKKINDGVCIFLDECDDDESVLKTYYELVNKEFQGVCVGVKDIVIKALLSCIVTDITGHIENLMSKEPKETVKCAIVYYANGLKHYVPLDYIVEE